MLQIPGLKIVRVYGDRKEQAEFPIPNKPAPLKYPTDEDDHNFNEDAELKAVSLHHIIRSHQCPFAAVLYEYESKFEADKEEGRRTSDKEVDCYLDVRFLKSFLILAYPILEGTHAAKTGSIASRNELFLWLATVLVPVIEIVGRLSSLSLT